MKVLHVMPSLRQSYGGPLRAVLDLSARALKFGLDSHVLGFGPIDIPDNPLAMDAIHALPVTWNNRFCYSAALNCWLEENIAQYDGVVLHGMWTYPNWAVASACRRHGVPYACFPHGMLEPWAVFRQGPWKLSKKVVYWRLIEERIFRSARCVFFTTDRERSLAETTFRIGGAHLILIPYGMETGVLMDSAEPSPAVQLPQDWRVALYLGRIHEKKNIAFLIQAWADARPPAEWHLVIAGSGDERLVTLLKKLVARHGLEGNVHFTGFVAGAEKAYLLHRADWFVLPSRQENFGIAVLEAIAVGCPVAISDQVFIAEMLHERSEVLPLSSDEWVRFISERMPDMDWRNELARLDAHHLDSNLNIDKVSRDWADTITHSLAGEN